MAWKRVELTHPGTPDRFDPEVMRALAVWGSWDAEEQREAFRWVFRVALAYERTGDVRHLVRYAESLRTTVALESSTDIRQRIRESRDRTPTPADPADVEALIRRLEA